MRYVVFGMLLILMVLHQSGIAADSKTLLFGFLPAGLAFQMGISLAAGATWLFAALFAWPVDDEDPAGGEQA